MKPDCPNCQSGVCYHIDDSVRLAQEEADAYPGPEPDPRHWVQCSCGKFKMYGPDLKTVMDWLNLHTKINKDTHFSSGGFNSYMLHIPPKPSLWAKIRRKIRAVKLGGK